MPTKQKMGSLVDIQSAFLTGKSDKPENLLDIEKEDDEIKIMTVNPELDKKSTIAHSQAQSYFSQRNARDAKNR
jgi:hypothetical protein